MFDGNQRWNAIPVAGGELYRVGPAVDLHPGAAVLPGPRRPSRRRSQRHPRRARAGDARRLGHHRPHLAGRRHRARTARPGAGCKARGVEKQDFNSYGARRGNDLVMMRGTFANIRLKNLLVPGRRRAASRSTSRAASKLCDLRRGRALPRRGHAADRAGGQGVRHRLVARLGGQGHAAARRARRDRRELRAHPPLQPGRHGRAAAAVRARADRREPGAHRARDVRRRRPRGRARSRASKVTVTRPARGRRDAQLPRRSPGSTRRSRSTTTGTAASSRPC